MNYGHSRNTGHGHRIPTYEWSPALYPSRRRRPRTASRSRHLQSFSHRTYRSTPPRETYTKLSLVPSDFGDAVAEILIGAIGTTIWLYWEFFLAAGLVTLLLRFLSRRMKKAENKCLAKCERECRVHRIHRKPAVSLPPSPEQLTAAWEATQGGHRGDPAILTARLRLGALLSDLESTVDQSYIRDEDGTIIGRRPGIKGWLGEHCPELLRHYKALMSYKALADKVALATGVSEQERFGSILSAIETPQKAIDSQSEDAGKTAGKTTDGKGVSPKSTLLSKTGDYCRTEDSNATYLLREMMDGLPRKTMAALEMAARERLGLVWMTRGRRRPTAA